MSIIGSAESVGKIKRQHVHLYKQQYYVPQNIVVSVCGRVKYERFTQQVGKIFGGLKNTSIGAFLRVKEEQESPQLKLFNKDTEQTHLALGFHSFHRDHPLRHALGMLHVALGANMSSRLFNEVREKRGLAYEIGTQVKRFHDTGAFIVHAGIDNSKVTEAVSVILRELKKISEKQISVDEFRRAKEFYIGQLVLALEDTLDQMLWVGESTVALNRTYTLEEIIRQVKRLTREDICSVAQQLFKEENLNLAIIGPLKDSEDALYKRLSFD